MNHFGHMMFLCDGLELKTDKRTSIITAREYEQCKFQCLQLINTFCGMIIVSLEPHNRLISVTTLN